MEKKMTKLEMFARVKEVLGAGELGDFIDNEMTMLMKAQAQAKAKRVEKNGGEAKDITQSDFYSKVRAEALAVIGSEAVTGDEIAAQIPTRTASGNPVLAAQIATALKPAVENGTLVKCMKEHKYEDKNGLTQTSLRKAYVRL